MRVVNRLGSAKFERVTLRVREGQKAESHQIVTKIGAKQAKISKLQKTGNCRYLAPGKGIYLSFLSDSESAI
jgi:hypothetical protein